MPEYKRLNTGVATLILWRVEESEEQLKAIIGGDSFPALAQKNPQHRLEWLAVRCSLNALGIADSIIYQPNRRPFLSKGKPYISITHSHPYTGVIVSSDFQLGIDIEAADRSYIEVADRFLTPGEKAWMGGDDARRMAIVWAAKETLYKLFSAKGLNSFTDINVMPISGVGERGSIRARVRLCGQLHSLSMEYFFFANYVLTWVACAPALIQEQRACAEGVA